jgi:hypothetical protein
MFPWRPDEWNNVLGLPSIVEKIAAKARLDKNTVRAFIHQERRLRPSTIEGCGLEQIQQLMDQTSMKKGDNDHDEVRTYSGFFKLILKVSDEACDAGLGLPGDFGNRVLSCGRTIYAILWTESVYLDAWERKVDHSVVFGPEGPFASFVAGMHGKRPSQDFDHDNDIYNLHLHHALMFFLAALDLDIDIQPERLFPRKVKNKLRRPMYCFVESLRKFAEARSWAELGRTVDPLTEMDDGGNTEFEIRRWANAQTLKHCWSWERLNKLLDRLELGPLDDPDNGGDQRRIDILRNYGLARILHEHFQRIHPSLIRAGIADEDLHDFYFFRFNACKENECRRIPLHP